MKISLNHHSDQPLYEQIASQIRQGIIFGDLLVDSPLASIRELSKALGLSLHTVKRAYDILKVEGYIYVVSGKGFFVNNKNVLKEKSVEEIKRQARALSKTLRECGFTREDIVEIVNAAWTSKTQ